MNVRALTHWPVTGLILLAMTVLWTNDSRGSSGEFWYGMYNVGTQDSILNVLRTRYRMNWVYTSVKDQSTLQSLKSHQLRVMNRPSWLNSQGEDSALAVVLARWRHSDAQDDA
jgi:hypothetical protein